MDEQGKPTVPPVAAPTEQPPATSGYGKKNWMKWIFIYLVIGAILYAGFYYFILAKASNPYSTNSSPTSAPVSVQEHGEESCVPKFKIEHTMELTASEVNSTECLKQTSKDACERVDIFDARTESFGTSDGVPDCQWLASQSVSETAPQVPSCSEDVNDKYLKNVEIKASTVVINGVALRLDESYKLQPNASCEGVYTLVAHNKERVGVYFDSNCDGSSTTCSKFWYHPIQTVTINQETGWKILKGEAMANTSEGGFVNFSVAFPPTWETESSTIFPKGQKDTTYIAFGVDAVPVPDTDCGIRKYPAGEASYCWGDTGNPDMDFGYVRLGKIDLFMQVAKKDSDRYKDIFFNQILPTFTFLD